MKNCRWWWRRIDILVTDSLCFFFILHFFCVMMYLLSTHIIFIFVTFLLSWIPKKRSVWQIWRSMYFSSTHFFYCHEFRKKKCMRKKNEVLQRNDIILVDTVYCCSIFFSSLLYTLNKKKRIKDARKEK